MHIDRDDFEHVDFCGPVDDLGLYPDNSVSEIYTSHTLEYFDRQQTPAVLGEWWRVMMPGASIYITVPNFDSLIDLYRVSGSLERVLGPLYGRWQNQELSYPIYHKTVWNIQDLTNALTESGFVNCREFNPISYLTDIDQDYDDFSLAYYPHLNRDGLQISLCLTAQKPWLKD